LHLDKLGFYLPVTEQKIYDLNGDFIFDARTVNFNDVSGKIDNGSFDLNGSFDINNKLIENINITAKTTLLPISYPDHFDGAVNLDLSYAGNLSTGKLNGNIIVEDALYFKDFDPFGNIFSGQNKKTITVSSEKKQLPNISLNLTLRSRRTLVLDNNFAFLELKPDLDITGNLNSPLISGRTKIEKDGFIVFQKNTFAINKGILDFNPIYGMLPTVDIQSETKVNDHRIFLSVSENLSNPKFSLTSIPTESDADILSILLFGRKADEFVSGTNGVAVTKEKLVADWLYNTYQKDIAKKTGLDQIELTVPNNFSATKPQGYGLTVGKNISDRLVLKYSVVNNSSEFVQKGIADYKLLENIVFSGFQSTDNQFGAEIKYRLEFR
ncbi:MAG: translocation/assembly module TamB domain-containing protein, partial [Candidatus Delongbacteria bacterium]|nr:translocation/assembly module TamB domain-containing protein [Candidatus Delongbacteria bacterium]